MPASPRSLLSGAKPTTPKVTTLEAAAVVPETPKQPRGILKQNDFSQKKRRVVFAGSGEPHSSSSGDEEENVSNLTKVGKKCFYQHIPLAFIIFHRFTLPNDCLSLTGWCKRSFIRKERRQRKWKPEKYSSSKYSIFSQAIPLGKRFFAGIEVSIYWSTETETNSTWKAYGQTDAEKGAKLIFHPLDLLLTKLITVNSVVINTW